MTEIITLITGLPDEQEAGYLAALAAAMPAETIVALRKASADELARSTIAIVARPDPAALAVLPRLAWIQSLWAGVEQLVASLPPDGTPVVRLVDPELSRTMAEAVLAWTYYLQRDMPAYRLQQQARVWTQQIYRKPADTTVGIVGLGTLGGRAANRLIDAGFRVSGWSRTPKTLAGVCARHGTDGLVRMLGESDIVVCLVPLTADTRRLVDRQAFAAMKRGAALINFSRGPVVAAQDLLQALDDGQLSHAVLDVFDIEPLPGDSPFWQHPAVTVLPHISAPTDIHTAASVIATNVATYRATGRIPDSIDFSRGY
ncbi:phosphoglycerate dehydrogenase-like oxidoreductase [Burkholderia sp. Ch1-1]|uniref:D-3-phosphoglycerate dehydrogenase n=1 Tax=Paraburkholderia dioscoreae TaxID=2604047 RepID=A0A5Q4ZP01_9BURK|nr:MULTISPECIES: glyoxylate/hydroxypyruvate reductase A [Paraburkholderia]EIF34891.1 phosphoglycerate dehydrogenase-like oxidoreductase [Burkholderia sp. Ch1-1]MDR8396548.1 glyoxylate/hydroxypyruvate reductase A [Paraburkholderia sp. USG1]VVD34069.1 D-3-phosphoglycerate dehydrogenase [Paraburkholderia dioscoreae]